MSDLRVYSSCLGSWNDLGIILQLSGCSVDTEVSVRGSEPLSRSLTVWG